MIFKGYKGSDVPYCHTGHSSFAWAGFHGNSYLPVVGLPTPLCQDKQNQLFYKHAMSKDATEDVTAHQLHQQEGTSSVRAVLRLIHSELTMSP